MSNIDDQLEAITKQMNQAEVAAGIVAKNLPINEIHPDPNQPRSALDTDDFKAGLKDLAGSIRVHGVLEPILVTRDETGYRIVAGERRWRAAKDAGLTQIPAIIRDSMQDDQRFIVQVVENIQREDMSDLDTGRAIRRLLDMGFKRSRIAEQFGKSPAFVTRMMDYLEAYEDPETRDLAQSTTPQVLNLFKTKSPEVKKLALEIAKKEAGDDDVRIFRRHLDRAQTMIDNERQNQLEAEQDAEQGEDHAVFDTRSNPETDPDLPEPIEFNSEYATTTPRVDDALADDDDGYAPAGRQSEAQTPPKPAKPQPKREFEDNTHAELMSDVNVSDIAPTNRFDDVALSDSAKELSQMTNVSAQDDPFEGKLDEELDTDDTYLLFSKPLYISKEGLSLFLGDDYDPDASENDNLELVRKRLVKLGFKAA